MKKILFAAMALGMCMTSCMNDEFPNAVQYGYINLNVSNNPVMVTRAGEAPKWQLSATKDGESYTNIAYGLNKVPAGTYTITAQSHESEEAANKLNTYGEPYFYGTSTKTITAGQSIDVVIDCGTATNSKLTLVNNLNSDVFKEVKLNAISDDRKLSLSSENSSAFYSTETEVSYNISYKYNGSQAETVIKNGDQDYTITIAEAAKDYQIKLTSTDNGTINITVKYDNEFGLEESKEIIFDAATGDIQQ